MCVCYNEHTYTHTYSLAMTYKNLRNVRIFLVLQYRIILLFHIILT